MATSTPRALAHPPVTRARIRALHAEKQGLCGPTDTPVVTLCDQLGWPRTLGGVDGYVTFWSRNPAVQRAEIDAAVADLSQLRVVPAARSCIMLAGADTAALALRLGYALWWKRTARDLDKVGVDPEEFAALQEAARAALGEGGLTTDAWRRALPAGVVRPLGDTGKKIGMSTAFPAAVRALEGQGAISRVADPDLVGQRYTWQRTPERAAELAALPADPVALAPAIAARYLRVGGPASAKELADWSGLPIGACKKALKALQATAVPVVGERDPVFADAADVEALAAEPRPVTAPQLLSFVDPWLDHRNDMGALVDPAHRALEIPAAGRSAKPIGQLKGLWTRAITDEGRLVGLWDWDPDANAVVTGTFGALPAGRAQLLRDRADALTAWLRDSFGHGRCYSIDSESAMRRRVARVRALPGGA